MRRRAMRRVATVVFGAPTVLVLAAMVAGFIQYQVNDHVIKLPSPRGSHPVGRMLVDWTDAGRNRELMVFIWYPAAGGSGGRQSEYIPGAWGALESENMAPIPATRLRDIEVSAIDDATVADGVWPALIFLPGMGRIPAHYTTLAEDLASFGYVVAGVTPTGAAPVVFPDGRVDRGREFDPDTDGSAAAQAYVRTWADDASFALDRLVADSAFAGRVRHDSAGIFGHSFGGNVALHALQEDTRFDRAANLDGWLFGDPVKDLDKPILVLVGQAGIQASQQAVCDSDRAGGVLETFAGAGHMNFSDAGVLPSRFPLPRSLLQLGEVNGAAFLYEVSDRLRTFFDTMR